MKNTNIILKIIFLILTLQTCTSQPIELPWYQCLFNKGNGIVYHDNCNNINTIQNIRCIALTAYYRITNKKAHLDKILCSIKTELARVEKWILGLEQEALNAIKEKYHISNEIWHKYMADLHRMKIIREKQLKISNPEIAHDPNIPVDILEILTLLLKQNGINPQSIHLRMISDQEKIDKHPDFIAWAFDNYNLPYEISGDNILLYDYEPSAIEIFPRINEEKTIANKIATCAHEIQHIIQHHSLTKSILVKYLAHYYNVQEDEVRETPEYHRLSQIHEAQAEILSAIKDPKTAECLKQLRQTSYYPDHLYEDHFFHLAYINTLWKIHGWLEYFHQNDPLFKYQVS